MKRTIRSLVVGSVATASLFTFALPASAKPVHPHETDCVVMAGKSAEHRKGNPAGNKWCESTVIDTTDTTSDTGGDGYDGPVFSF